MALFLGLTSLNAFAQNSGIITTVAGNGGHGYSGDGGLATNAELNNPTSIVADGSGNFYIGDTANFIIRKVDQNGIVTTIAGTPGVQGYSGDGGPAAQAKLFSPSSVALDSAGNLYVLDGCVVREIATTGIITTVAGENIGYPFSCYPSLPPTYGNGGPATSVTLDPTGMTVDTKGTIYISEVGLARIRKVTNGIITTIAQNTGTTPLFETHSLAVDGSGNLYIADVGPSPQFGYTDAGFILKLTNGVISVVAGGIPLNYTGASYGDGGPATSADIGTPSSVWVDSLGNIFIADSFNNAIRKVATSGIITTVAGGPHPDGAGFAGDGGPATSALLDTPQGVTASPTGTIYIADTGNYRIRAVGASQVSSCTSQTVVSVPGQPDSRTTIGVGEVVQLNTTLPVVWTVAGNGFLNEPTNGACTPSTLTTSVQGTQACFTAPFTGDQDTVTAVFANGDSCSIPFNTVAPSGLIFQRVVAPGYSYKDPAQIGDIAMWSVAFLIPGNVSFQNIGIAEQDHADDSQNFIAPPYTPPVLVRINPNTNGWLIGCDFDLAPLFPSFYVSNWVYTWGSDSYLTANKQQFATVETQITFPLFVWLFQKGQIQSGVFNSFINPTANLFVPYFSAPSVLGPHNRDACLPDIMSQFGVVM